MSGDGLSIDVTRHDATVTAAVRGELDLTTASRLEDALAELRPGDRCTLDLRELDFMDSTGVRLLMRLDLRARSEGFELVIAARPGMVARLLEMCRVADRIPIVGDPASVA